MSDPLQRKTLSPDTTAVAQRTHFALMHRLPGLARLTLPFELPQATRKLGLSDIRHRFPGASEEEIRRRFIARVLPRKDVIRAYGFDPRQEGY